ncbi:uncharacterized protein LOC135489646 [Lineus longissimus]|uniref:uncharacterized protein LOC135489646 n=1 Tax=Lineus longissimus TaxID=88925 RepID=UPI002B4E8E6E
MVTHSIPALCLAILLSVLLKLSTTAGTEHCIGPVKPLQVVKVGVEPELGDANFMEIKLRSIYKLDVAMSIDGTPIVVRDEMIDDGSTQATKSQDGDDYVIIIASLKGVKSSSLSLGLRSQHPCNTLLLWVGFPSLRRIFEEGIAIPAVSVFPKRAYSLDKYDSFLLRYGITFRDDGKLGEIERQAFSPIYQWNETNIMYSTFGEGAPRANGEPKKFDFRRTNSSANGFKTLTSELDVQLGSSLPFDGAVISAMCTLAIGPEDIYMYVFTSLQFKDISKRLPMRVESSAMNKPLLQMGYQKRQGLDMVTVGLNYRIPEGMRGLTCAALGVDTAPHMAIARLASVNDANGDITKVEQVELPYPPFRIGALGFIDTKVNQPVGSETYYVCSASSGDDVTSIIIKVISMVPLEVTIEVARSNRTERYEATCTASGDPKPSIRLFLVPGHKVLGASSDSQIPEQYRNYELTDSTSQVNVTSTTIDSYTRAKTMSLYRNDWADMDGYGYNLECYASTANQVEKQTTYLNNGYSIY